MASFREQRYNRLFKMLREDIYNLHCDIRTNEDSKGISDCVFDATKYYAVIFFFMIIYCDIVDTTAELLTWDEYKEKYEFDDIGNCVFCFGLNLTDLADKFGFVELIANNGVDNQTLIDAIPDTTNISYSC